jgi:hypothetical protein
MVRIGSFKGHPTIALLNAAEDRYPFTFGIAKAKKILENLEAIKKFVAEAEAAANKATLEAAFGKAA